MSQEGVQSTVKASGLLGGIASVLNFGGRTIVKTYDIVTEVGSKAFNVIGKTASAVGSGAPKVLGDVKGLFGKVSSGQKGKLKAKIAEYEDKIKKLYYEIGKESSSAQKLESEKVNELIAKVREYEQEIERLNQQITEMAEIEKLKAEEAKKEKPAKKKLKVSDEQAIGAIKSAIENALKQGAFDSESQKEIFKKIAHDLCDDEMEVRILAAAELGKMGISPASDVLIEAVKFDNPYLTAEVINSLTNIGDARVLGICKENVKSPNHRCRISSLRGLYKIGANEEVAPYLIEALNDEHPEVRRTAITFLGWKDINDAVPGIIQCLQDKDEGVRKAAVTALANIKDESSVLPLMRVLSDDNTDIRKKAYDALVSITGESIDFDTNLKGKALTESIEKLKEWWQSERISKIGEVLTPEPAMTQQDESISEAKTEKTVEETQPTDRVSYVIETTPEEITQPLYTTEEPLTTEVDTSTSQETATSLDEQVQSDKSEPQTPTNADLESFDAEWTEESLKKKLKSDLIAMCKSKGIECDESFTKAELISMLLKA